MPVLYFNICIRPSKMFNTVLVHAVQKQSHERHYCNSIVAKRYFKNYDEKHLHLTFHINELNLALH